MLEQYLIVLSLPCGYRSRSIKFIILLLSLILISILYTSGYYQYITGNNENYIKIFVLFVLTYSFFLKFNIIVRFYNIFVRSIRYFYKNIYNSSVPSKAQENLVSNKIILYYYLYNILCLILSFFLIYKLDMKIMEYSKIVFDIYVIYSLLFSGIIGYLYIDYLSNIRVKINNINLSKLGLIYLMIITMLLVFGLMITLINVINLVGLNFDNLHIFNIVKNDGVDSDNTQVNTNVQSSTTNNNSQTNSNNQNNIITNPSGESSSQPTNSNTNKQVNINVQNNSNEQNDIINYQSYLQNARNGINLKEHNLQSDITEQKYDSYLSRFVQIVGNRVNYLGNIYEEDNKFVLYNNSFNYSNYSFFDSLSYLLSLKRNGDLSNYELLTQIKYLIRYACRQDVNNLLSDVNLSLNIDFVLFSLENKIIYMNNTYSIMFYNGIDLDINTLKGVNPQTILDKIILQIANIHIDKTSELAKQHNIEVTLNATRLSASNLPDVYNADSYKDIINKLENDFSLSKNRISSLHSSISKLLKFKKNLLFRFSDEVSSILEAKEKRGLHY